MMGAATGSSVAAVAAMGRALGPEMLQRGYKPGYVGALNASAGLLGVLIPPSIPVILYGSAVGASITQLFLATLLPGLMFLVAIMAVHALRARHVLADGVEQEALSSAATRTFRGEFLSALPALFMPLLVLGGIYTGIFTPTEAAGVAAIYALLYIIVSRSAGSHQLSEAFVRAAISAAAVMFIIGFTTIFSRALTLEQIPQDLANFAIDLTQNPLMFLLLVSLVLLVVGMFMETSATVLLMGPLLAPAASQYGIDPIHFGIIVVINIEIGLLTPLLAANLYVASLTNRIPIMALLRQIGWFLLACLIMLVAITYVPGIALWYHILPGY
jgi:C4-dicarboxylate transporter DctM subunit